MFNFFKRKPSAESTQTTPPLGMWQLSEDEQLLEEIGEYTYDRLERMKVDLKRRKFRDKDGKKYDIGQIAQRLHAAKPNMPTEDIEVSVMSWLEEAYEPEGITDGDQEEQAQLQIEAWLESHEEARQESETG